MTTPKAVYSLLIATRNRKGELLRTLEVVTRLLGPQDEIIVLDDGSADGTSEAVQESYPHITLLTLRSSIGYIAARNQLLKLAKGDYAISLDDDAEIVAHLDRLGIADYFQGHPTCGVLALPVYWGRKPPDYGLLAAESARRVSSFVGCGHIWRLEAWRSIRPYPEWFEMYGEEDFAAISLLRAGWEIHYFPKVLVHHRVVLASRSRVERRWRYRRHFRAGLYNMLLFDPWVALPHHLGYSIGSQIRNRLITGRDWFAVPGLLGVLWDLARSLPKIATLRRPLTLRQWTEWRSLEPAVIYWSPKSLEGERNC